MPRTARVAPKEHVYHVLTRGNDRQNVFEDEDDFRKYLDLLFRRESGGKNIGSLCEECSKRRGDGGEMDRRIVYGGEDFVKDMTTTYHISEKRKRIGRQRV